MGMGLTLPTLSLSAPLLLDLIAVITPSLEKDWMSLPFSSSKKSPYLRPPCSAEEPGTTESIRTGEEPRKLMPYPSVPAWMVTALCRRGEEPEWEGEGGEGAGRGGGESRREGGRGRSRRERGREPEGGRGRRREGGKGARGGEEREELLDNISASCDWLYSHTIQS